MVLFAPMVKIHDDLLPPPVVVKFLRKIARKHPKAKIGKEVFGGFLQPMPVSDVRCLEWPCAI